MLVDFETEVTMSGAVRKKFVIDRTTRSLARSLRSRVGVALTRCDVYEFLTLQTSNKVNWGDTQL